MSIITPTLSYLQNSEKILPMLLIEIPCSAGRTYQGYKRGGESELKERVCEESLGAVVWLFGTKAFNKAGDIIGKNILGLKDLDTNVGRDALRDPFSNVADKRALTACFKFSKITLSSILSIIAMGAAVPKIKKAMTNAFRAKSGQPLIPDKNGEYTKGWADKLAGLFIKPDKNSGKNQDKNDVSKESKIQYPMPDMETFRKETARAPGNPCPSFGGGSLLDGVLFASHNLENSTPWRLLTTDFGTLTGRVANSRTKKEAVEYAVRDSTSSLAYIFAAPLFSAALRKITKTPDVHPEGAEVAAVHLNDIISKNGGNVSHGFFSSKFALSDEAKELVSNIKFDDNGTVSLESFNIQTCGRFADKAKLMSKLQPEIKGKKPILSKMQVNDIFSDSYTSDPAFLKKAISSVTGGKSDDSRVFISRRRLEKIRTSFDDFTLSLEKYANKKGSDIDCKLVNKFAKNLNRKNFAIHMAGIGFAVICLAVLIPKLQYFVSDKLDSESGFAGSLTSDKNKEDN